MSTSQGIDCVAELRRVRLSTSLARLRKSRRGVAIVMVLGLLAITFSVAFMMTRGQVSSLQLRTNASLDLQAREAALTGYRAGLRKMHESAWGGVDTSLSGTVRTGQTYTISFLHGDPRLAASDAKQPYRVTMLVTGTATDPSRGGITATQQLRAIAELVPKKIADAPTTFTNAQSHTVYQYSQDTIELQPPCQIQGSVRWLNTLSLGNSYFNSASERDRYFADVNAVRVLGGGDNRPVQGPISVPTSLVSTTILNRLQTGLGCTVVNIPNVNDSNWSFPGAITSYRLYPGGKTYQAQSISSFLSNTTLIANPATNPLGIFYRNGQVQLCDNVNITGTVVCTNLLICGNSVTLTAPSLPALDGSSSPIKLPAVISGDDMYVYDGTNLTIRGAVALFDDFFVEYGSYSTRVDIQGRVICKGFQVKARSDWNLDTFSWSFLYNTLLNLTGTQYYPTFLEGYGLSSVPRITVKPETSAAQYMWKNTTNQVYMPLSTDPGLRWSIVDYDDHYEPPTDGTVAGTGS